ncbi:hypothetical protein EDP2_2593 [Enterobacter cloacae S611]|uniref:Uncharacterized protein n=1 Tax=Enterobacter cloacae S611 TaxID=1399146 RepID=A0ABP2ZS66_ENTCL|nr:hypothetical protein EDP2_2593 [Enterobacter cloacae S611]
MVGNGFVPAEGLVFRGGVRQHHHVPVGFVTEVVGNALKLHQTTDEVKTALLILHAVAPAPVASRQAVLKVHLVFAKQGFHDLRHRLLLEDAQVAVALHRPHIRLHRQPVDRIPRPGHLRGTHRHAGDFAVEVAHAAGNPLRRHIHRHRLAEQLAAVDTRVGAQHRQGEGKRFRQRLATGEFPEKQAVYGQLNRDPVLHGEVLCEIWF